MGLKGGKMVGDYWGLGRGFGVGIEEVEIKD